MLSEDSLAEALEQLKIARLADPQNEQIDIMEAECLNSAGKFEEAVEVCEKIVNKGVENGRKGDSAALVIMSSAKVVAMKSAVESLFSSSRSSSRCSRCKLLISPVTMRK